MKAGLTLLFLVIPWAVAAQQTGENGALPSLDAFLASSRKHAVDNVEAAATERQRSAEHRRSVHRLLPALTASASYTRNQYDGIATVPDGDSLREAAFARKNQLDASVGIEVPVIDVGAWQNSRASSAQASASRADALGTAYEVAQRVARAYCQLVAAQAVSTSAEGAARTSQQNLEVVKARLAGGLANELDLKRADSEHAAKLQLVAEASLSRQQAARSLRTLSGLPPHGQAPALSDDGQAEAPLESWLSHVSALPRLRAARESVRAADASEAAAYSALIPSISVNASERFTNAYGFGASPAWAISATAKWRFELASFSDGDAARAGTDVSRAKAERAEQDARDAVADAWDQVESLRVRVKAAQSETDAALSAATVARSTYVAGRLTHLELIQAERDAFAADVKRVQATADLVYARALLRISSGRKDGLR